MKKSKILFSLIILCLVFAVFCIGAMATESEEPFDTSVTAYENTNFSVSLDVVEGSPTKGTLTIAYNGNDTQLYLDNKDETQKVIYANFMAWKAVWEDSVTRIVVSGFSDNFVRMQSCASIFASWPELISVRIEPVDNGRPWNFRNYWMSCGWFYNCPKLTTMSIGGTETTGVIDLSGWGMYYRTWSQMFRDCTSITKVIFPTALIDEQSGKAYEKAAGIHEYMFLGASALNEITIPDWATVIEQYAFSGCTSLTEITVPGTVASIGTSAFSSGTISQVAYSAPTALKNVIFENGVETIGTNAFKNCTSLVGSTFTIGDEKTEKTGIVLPSSVTNVSAGAFSGTAIAAVKLLGAGTVIEAGALPEGTVVYCVDKEQQAALTANGYTAEYYIETISYGEQIQPDSTEIDYCWTLDSEGVLTIKSVKDATIDTDADRTAFAEWHSKWSSYVKHIVISNDMGLHTFYTKNGIAMLSGYENLISIDTGDIYRIHLNPALPNSGIFANNPSLTTVYSSTKNTKVDGVVNLSYINRIHGWGHGNGSLFAGCASITNVVFYEKTYSSAVFTLGNDAFSGCTKLEIVTLASDITSIGSNAFKNCVAIKYIEIPTTVTSIGASAFAGSGIETVRIFSTDSENFTIDATSFDDASKITAYVYSNAMKTLLVDTYGFTAENVSVILEGSFGDGSLDWEIADGTLTISGTGESLSFGDSVTADDLSLIPWIGNAEDITKVVITAPITAVSDYALAGLTNLKSVEIPNTLTDFNAKGLFYGANGLLSVYVTGFEAEEGVIDLFYGTAFSSELFDGCAIDAEVYLGKLTSFDFIDSWKEDLTSLGVCTYPTSTLATAIRAREDISLTYLPESHDSTLARSGETVGGDNFSWVYDDATETVRFTSVSGLFRIYKTNEANWVTWKNIWTDAVKHAVVSQNTTSVFINWSYSGSFFKNMKALESIHFETTENLNIRSTESSGYSLFYGCSALKTVSIGADATLDNVVDLSRCINWQSYPYGMFYGCSSITKVILPDNLKTINSSNAVLANTISPDMFANCTSLREIVIPACYTVIGNNSFAGCTALEKLYIMSHEADLSSATATTFPASEKLTIYVTSDKVKRDIDALGIAGTKVVDLSDAINAEGFSIRLKSYNGLRGIFSFDSVANENAEKLGFELKEYGVLICSEDAYNTAGGAYLMNHKGSYITKANAVKKLVVFDGEKYAKLLNSSNIPDADPNKLYFAATVVNYNNNFKSNVYMTGYAVYTDEAGNDCIVYSNYGMTNPDYEFISLYTMTMNMYLGGADMTGADEVAVWNTVLQGAADGYYEKATGTEGVSVTVVSHLEKNYSFVRSENGTALNDELVSAAIAEAAFEGELEGSFGVEIADMGTVAPVDTPNTPAVSTVTTPNRYSGADMAQHCQSLCTDGTYMYYSFTGIIVKVRISDGVEVGKVKVDSDINQFSAHIGNMICHEGKLYASVGFWGADKAYIGIINTDDIVGDVSTKDVMLATRYDEDRNITLFAGTDKETADTYHGGEAMLDSITVGKIPGGGFVLSDGSEIIDNNEYLVFAAGSAYKHPTTRHDDDYIRLRFVDFNDVHNNAAPLNSARIESEEGYVTQKHTAFVYAGSTCVQCVSYDKDTGDYYFATYGRDAGLDDAYPKYDFFVADGSQKLYLTEIYVGQNTPEDSEIYEISRERAAQFKDREDLDRDGDTEEQMLGWTMELRCVCGRHYIDNHDAFDYDNSGYAGKICGMGHPAMADQGIASLGNDYFYVSYYNNTTIDGVTYYGQQAQLFRLDRYNGAWSFARK